MTARTTERMRMSVMLGMTRRHEPTCGRESKPDDVEDRDGRESK
jgi:hypothetical protein